MFRKTEANFAQFRIHSEKTLIFKISRLTNNIQFSVRTNIKIPCYNNQCQNTSPDKADK